MRCSTRSHPFALQPGPQVANEVASLSRAVGPVVKKWTDGTGRRSKTKQGPVSRQAPESHTGWLGLEMKLGRDNRVTIA